MTPERARRTSGRRLRVLVVDDDQVNRGWRRSCSKAGYAVEAVGNGAEAVDAVARGRYDAVLMDCEMPVMDGYEAAAAIRKREAGDTRIPIIAITAGALKNDAGRALAAGMDAHVAKPIDRGTLERVVAELLDAGGMAEGPREPQAPFAGGEGLDTAVLEELRSLDDDGTALRSLVAIFVRVTPERMTRLRAAIGAGDVDAVRLTAHSLRGSAGTFGARTAAALAGDVEDDARAGRLSGVEVCDDLQNLLDSALAGLADYVRDATA